MRLWWREKDELARTLRHSWMRGIGVEPPYVYLGQLAQGGVTSLQY